MLRGSRVVLRPRSVRSRTTLVAVAVVAAAVAMTSVALVLWQRQVLQDSLDARLRQRARDVATAVEAGDPVDGLLKSTLGDDTVVQVVDARGVVVMASSNDDAQASLTSRSVPAGSIEMFSLEEGASDDHDEPLRVATTTSQAPTGELLSIYAAASDEAVRESVDALTRGLAIAGPGLLIVLGFVLWQVTGRALRPVEAIRVRADSIGADRLHARVPATGTGDEIDRLAATMNAMLARLEASAEQQRAFMADASHELRTPLAGIIAQQEGLGADPDPVAAKAARRLTLAEARRMQRLVEDLLVLNRTGPAAEPDRTGLVDLDDVVLDVVRHLPEEARRRVRTEQVSAGQARGCTDEVTRIVVNLIDNAVRHARTEVTVGLRETETSVVLRVCDDGPGVPVEDQERIFERFVRLDAARARGTGGSGLGLAIARTLAVVNGGTLDVDGRSNGNGGGAVFVLTLPAAASPSRPLSDDRGLGVRSSLRRGS